MTWIKIDADNLPEHDQRCFVYVAVGESGYVTVDTFNENKPEFWLEYYSHFMKMEFPKPPHKVEDDYEWRYFD